MLGLEPSNSNLAWQDGLVNHSPLDVPLFLSLGTAIGFLFVLLADFWIVDRRPHSFTTRDATRWVLFYVALAILFGLMLIRVFDAEIASQFFAAYLTEYSLSVDNLFVFLVIMTSFAVPSELQHRVLLVGVILALIFRALLILVGVSAINSFQPTFIIFGVFLIWTAYKVAAEKQVEEADEQPNNLLVRIVSRFAPTVDEYHGHKLTVKQNETRYLTPLLMVMIAIGGTDIMFALDSIPAVLGLTTEPFIVITANAFALMGLRQLFFLLQGLIEKLVHLARGIAIILAFIGVKLFILGVEKTFDIEIVHINTYVSLGVIVFVLATTTITSLLVARKNGAAE
jgi:tellurite resistance protein TerC